MRVKKVKKEINVFLREKRIEKKEINLFTIESLIKVWGFECKLTHKIIITSLYYANYLQ